jgi:hypothetical protein
MLGVGFSGAAAAGGRFIPPAPEISYIGTRTFSITNFDPQLVYTITPVTAGTASRSGSTITLNNTNMEVDVTVSPQKRGVSSTARRLGVKPLAYTTIQVPSLCASGDDNKPGFWILMPHECLIPTTVVAAAPANYVTTSTEYRRIT